MSSIDCQDHHDDTPLHWAVILENQTLVKFLLSHRAKRDTKNYSQNTPVMVACINRNYEILKLLVTVSKGDSLAFPLSLAQQQH
jgi:ankyrin repeat protein